MQLNSMRIRELAHGRSLAAILFRSATGVGSFQGISIFSRLASSFILARFLGPAGYGQYSFIMTVITFLSLPIAGGMMELSTREIASYHQNDQWHLLRGFLRRAKQASFAFALLLFVGLGTFAATKASWHVDDRWTLLLIGLTCLPFVSQSIISAGMLRGFGHVVAAQAPELIARTCINLLAIIGLFVLGWLTPITAMACQVIAALAACLCGFLLLRRMQQNVGTINGRAFFQTNKWGYAWLSFSLLAGVGYLTNQMGTLMLGWLGSSAQVGIFQVAQRSSQIIALPLLIIGMVLAPYITKAHNTGQHEQLQKLASQSARAVFSMATILGLPMIFFAGPLLNIVFGPNYAGSAAGPLMMLALAQLFNAALGPVGVLLTMSGHERLTLSAQLIAVILNSVICLIMIPSAGVEGAAYGTALGIICFNMIQGFQVHRSLRIHPTIL